MKIKKLLKAIGISIAISALIAFLIFVTFYAAWVWLIIVFVGLVFLVYQSFD